MRTIRDSLHSVVRRALADSAFPGAIAITGTSEGTVATIVVGRVDWRAGAPVPTDSTIWDLASLTKVVGTTTAVAQLWSSGMLELDAPAASHLPRLRAAGTESVTVRHLLTHAAGLPAHRPFFRHAVSRDDVLDSVYATPLDTAPGTRMVYSDLGAMLLGEIVERVSGEPLDAYLARRVFEPLGMRDTGFRPPPWIWNRVAPTERDDWRGRHVHGEVHDENAFALGGVAGHAGLFGSARDLVRFARMMLRRGELDGVRILEPQAIDTFTRVHDRALSHRALGWETPNGANSAGRLASASAYGHTGFTGVSLWIDPARDVFVVLLSNRVNPSRENRKILAVRPSLADAALAAYDAALRRRPPAPPPPLPPVDSPPPRTSP